MKKIIFISLLIVPFLSNGQFSFNYTPSDSIYTNVGGWSIKPMYSQKDSTGVSDSYFFKAYHKNFHFMNNSIKRNISFSGKGNFLIVDSLTGKLSSSKFIPYSRISGAPATYSFTGSSSQYTKGDGTYGTFTSPTTPTYNYGVSRTINSSSFTPSTTQSYRVTYNVSISCTATIGSAASGKVELQYYNGSTWVTVNEIANSNTVTLAVTLNSVNIQTVSVSGEFPSNTQLRLVPTVAGTTTITYIRGIEILY